MLRSGHIRQAVCDVMDGAKGPWASQIGKLFQRSAVEGVYKADTLDRNPLEPHVYDVLLGEITAHEASPAAARGTFRLVALQLTIPVVTQIKWRPITGKPPQNDHEIRALVSGLTVDRLDMISQSLATPEVLATTAEGRQTGIVSGLLRGPLGDGFPEVTEGVWDWEKRTVTHEVRARAIVRIDRS